FTPASRPASREAGLERSASVRRWRCASAPWTCRSMTPPGDEWLRSLPAAGPWSGRESVTSITAVPARVAVPRARTSAQARRLASRAGRIAFVGGLAYLVVVPLVRLQTLAFSHGARGYSTAYHTPRMADTIRTTIALALGSLSIALVLGTGLAY